MKTFNQYLEANRISDSEFRVFEIIVENNNFKVYCVSKGLENKNAANTIRNHLISASLDTEDENPTSPRRSFFAIFEIFKGQLPNSITPPAYPQVLPGKVTMTTNHDVYEAFKNMVINKI